ncbi:ATP-grasp domain-containing protein [Halobaculum marinum]|uniref:ATP-grasp domain-containing protein n=1 Tax=Halobaculum marinum TaxID=3031996 RepID=A0ABD5WQJ8_9EURY|nr:ATP-grasp domain-containing protein [Halobaculum sp. DT55]
MDNDTAERTVLIPAGVSAKSLTCVRSLGSKGVRTVVASSDPAVPASASKYCDEHVLTPSPYEDLIAYKETLVALASREAVRAIIPSREVDAFVLSRYREEFAEHVAPLWPTMDTLRKVHDGLLLADVAAAAGVPTPETMLFDDVDDWSRELIIKPRYSVLTSEYVDNLTERDCDGRLSPIHPAPGERPDRAEVLRAMFGHVPVVQSYAPIEHEYSFRALYDEGEPVATSLRRQVRGKSYAGGASVYRELVDIPELADLGSRILDELDWHGLATVQFIERADTGEYEFLEVNPRTWTSIPTDVRAGADYPYFYWQVATGDRDAVDPTHDLGPGTHLLFGEIQYLASVLTAEYPNAPKPAFVDAVREVVGSILARPAFDYLTLDDPNPFVQGAINQLRSGVRS